MRFLLLKESKLYVVKSTKRIVRIMNLRLFLSAVGYDDVINKCVVTSILDAVEKTTGIDSKFDPFPRGKGRTVICRGMEALLGGLMFVCSLLKVRVNPTGLHGH